MKVNNERREFYQGLINSIAGALRENKGLVDLDLWHGSSMSNEKWDIVFDSLRTHPILQVLDLCSETFAVPAVFTFRLQAVVDMFKIALRYTE
jgi:hypothetical protein